MLIGKIKPKTTDREPEAKPKTRLVARSNKDFAHLDLPITPEEPITTLDKLVWLIYGENKIGKTSLCSRFPDPLFIFFEPGGKGLRLFKTPQLQYWDEFVKVIDNILRSDRFKTIIIDPIDVCYKMAVTYILDKYGVETFNEKGSVTAYGNGNRFVAELFEPQIRRLLASGRGVVFVAHAEKATIETRTGSEYNKITPRMPTKGKEHILDIVNIEAFYGYYGDDRYFTIQGSDELDAGHHLKYNFRTPSGERVHSVPMFDPEDYSFDEDKAYDNLIAAFNNQQEGRYDPEEEGSFGPTLTPTKKVFKIKSKGGR